MKKGITRLALLAGYAIPTVYLAMWGDAAHGTMLLYLLIPLQFIPLGVLCSRTQNRILPLFGVPLCGVASAILLQYLGMPNADWYFTPMTASSLSWCVTFLILLAHLFWLERHRKQK